jgi:chromosome segregation and condensation protein ScpB
MINLQLSSQPETEKRLKKILNSVENQENFAQGIIDYQITELEKSILSLKLDLTKFEEQYQMTSAEFYQQFCQDNLGDEADFIVWSGLYEMWCQNETYLSELK